MVELVLRRLWPQSTLGLATRQKAVLLHMDKIVTVQPLIVGAAAVVALNLSVDQHSAWRTEMSIL